MFLAPLSVPPSLRASPNRPARRRLRLGAVLVAWLLVGCVVVVLVPAVRGGRVFGATLPFWLVVAPLVDLGWIERRRIARRVTESWRGFGRARPARNVRAQRVSRRAACSAARS